MKIKLKGTGVGVVLILAETLLVILSWLLSAMRLSGVRSLLSGEGIRWFIGDFATVLASPLLLWLVLLPYRSSLITYRDRIAIRVSLAFLIIYLIIISLLTLMPHAILLSASGQLFPSAFSRSLVPLVAFGVCLVSVTFGYVSGRFRSLSDVLSALSFGIEKGAPLFILYILLIQFYQSLRFVFG